MNRDRVSCCALVAITILSCAFSVQADTFSFQGIGDVPGGGFSSSAFAVSANGSVVIGHGLGPQGSQAYRWTQATGMVLLDDAPFNVFGRGVSGDGNVAVGASGNAVSWSGGTKTALGFVWAFGTNGDGSVIVGYDYAQPTQAVRWTSETGPVGLGYLPGDQYSVARAVSQDGTVVVGRSSDSQNSDKAFRWTSASGMVGLGSLSDEYVHSDATAISPDGSVVVGYSWNGSGFEAFRWTEAEGMVGLGDVPGGNFDSRAYGVSELGTIVGMGKSASGNEALFWSPSLQMVSVRDLLLSKGVTELADWQLTEAFAISADGRTIVGSGINPQGFEEAWVATIPEPSSVVLIAMGATMHLGLVIRRRLREAKSITTAAAG